MASEMAAEAAAAMKPATRVYVTFLAGDYYSGKGVLGLAMGLRKVGSAYPLVVAVLPDVPESLRCILVSQGCIVREIEPVYPPENQTKFAMADYYAFNYSKLRIWEFVEYERMVYLDAGTQVVENIDELFELEKGHFYAAMDCFCEKTWSHSPQYKIGYCQQQSPDKALPWPAAKLGPPPKLYFNAGMFVHEPSMATAKALLDTLRVTPPTPFAEQDFLNMFFGQQYKPIPLENVQLENMKVVHYCAAGYTGKEANMERVDLEMLAKKWDIYNDETLDLEGLPADDADEVEKKLAPFSNWLTEAKDVIFAPNNLAAMATLAASSAAAGVVATAANPAICFSFYAVFIAAIAVVMISLRAI